MALGEILKNARLQKGLTTSQVAESTHLMVQVVECLEKEDFRRIAAAIYGRGFVKLYAQFLGLDPDPLVRDFVELYDGAKPPVVRTRGVQPEEAPPVAVPRAAPAAATRVAPAAVTAQRPVVQTRPTAAVPEKVSPPAAQKVTPASEPIIKTRPAVRPTVAMPQTASAPEKIVPPVTTRKTTLVTLRETPAPANDEQKAPTKATPPEPDLFHPFAEPPKGSTPSAQAPALDKVAQAAAIAAEKAKSEADAAKSREVRKAKIQTFITQVSKVKAGFSRFWGFIAEHGRQVLLTGGTVAALFLLAFGVRTLFRLTEHQSNAVTGSVGAVCDPPPAMYAD